MQRDCPDLVISNRLYGGRKDVEATNWVIEIIGRKRPGQGKGEKGQFGSYMTVGENRDKGRDPG